MIPNKFAGFQMNMNGDNTIPVNNMDVAEKVPSAPHFIHAIAPVVAIVPTGAATCLIRQQPLQIQTPIIHTDVKMFSQIINGNPTFSEPTVQPQPAQSANDQHVPPAGSYVSNGTCSRDVGNLCNCDVGCCSSCTSNDATGSGENSCSKNLENKPYRCDFCSKQFTRRDTLQIHRRVHTGERPFQCDLCSKTFAQRDKLQIHRRIHTGEKPYQCNVCQKTFARRDTLKIHTRTHTGERPFYCDVCSRGFAQRDQLHVHKRTHTGEKPFHCDICIQRFARRDTLQIHRRIHTGEKPFSCEVCGKVFAQTGKLQRHRRTHKTSQVGMKTVLCLKSGTASPQNETLTLKEEHTINDSRSQMDSPNSSKEIDVQVYTSTKEYSTVNSHVWQSLNSTAITNS